MVPVERPKANKKFVSHEKGKTGIKARCGLQTELSVVERIKIFVCVFGRNVQVIRLRCPN